MTDPELADAHVRRAAHRRRARARSSRARRRDALLPTLGGQTALNLALALRAERACSTSTASSCSARRVGGDREGRGSRAVQGGDGAHRPRRARAPATRTRSRRRARSSTRSASRRSCGRRFTLGGTGGGIAYNARRVRRARSRGRSRSRRRGRGARRGERARLEGVRARGRCATATDNFIIICSIENLDPMGVHTGDSITVAPAMTLTDREYQRMRDAARAVMREIGVETGGSNVQFAVDPDDRPHARHRDEPARVAQLGAGVEGDRLPDREDRRQARRRLHARRAHERHHARRRRPRSSRPSTTSSSRCRASPSRSSPAPTPTLGTQMKTVGEVMAIGRTFREALRQGGALARDRARRASTARARRLPRSPSSSARIGDAPTAGPPVPARPRRSRARARPSSDGATRSRAIDPWFLAHIRDDRRRAEQRARRGRSARRAIEPTSCARVKRLGFTDRQLAALAGRRERRRPRARATRSASAPVYTRVDTCAAEFVAHTPYLYSTYETTSARRARPTRRKVIILGGGPNRIGQGIEFDYCCVHAVHGAARGRASRPSWSTATRRRSRPTTTPPTGSTSSRSRSRTCSTICDVEKPDRRDRAVRRADAAQARACRSSSAGVQLLGTSADAIDRAEDRERFGERARRSSACARRAGASRAALDEALRGRRRASATRCWCGPSYVLGGRAMEIVYDARGARAATSTRALEAAARGAATQTRSCVDQFLTDAIEVDVDAVADGKRRGHRRRDAAHRGGRHPLGRLGVRAAAALAAAPTIVDDDRGADARARARARRRRPDERAVRGARAARSTSSR